MSRYRTRIKDVQVRDLTRYQIDGNRLQQRVFLVTRQQTWDEEHPWHWYRKAIKNPRQAHWLSHVRDVGGEFTSRTDSVETPDVTVLIKHPFGDYVGHLIPTRPAATGVRPDVGQFLQGQIPSFPYGALDPKDGGSQWPTVSNDASDPELGLLGAKLLSSLAPDAPHNSVYTSLGELKNDGLPSIPFLSFLKDGKLPEKVGGEWLNYQFGIAPTISDVKKIAQTVKSADKLIKQYMRDSGRIVRRKADMDPVIETTSGIFLPARSDRVPMGTGLNHWSSVGPVLHTTRTETRRWYSAGYSYYVDESSLRGMAGWLEKSNYLYGWKPDYSAMYNLTAWSWLLDWFTNTGDVIDNISMYVRDPSLVRWAYIMEETSVTVELSQPCMDNAGVFRNAQASYKTVLKKRRKVNPLYWGLKREALNARQLSILAALGMTKFSNPGSM